MLKYQPLSYVDQLHKLFVISIIPHQFTARLSIISSRYQKTYLLLSCALVVKFRTWIICQTQFSSFISFMFQEANWSFHHIPYWCEISYSCNSFSINQWEILSHTNWFYLVSWPQNVTSWNHFYTFLSMIVTMFAVLI